MAKVGGDITRKRKLLEAKGQEDEAGGQRGVPQEAFGGAGC